jgi:hypothetical protein
MPSAILNAAASADSANALPLMFSISTVLSVPVVLPEM